LKDKVFSTFLGQNPPFELRLKTGVSPPIFRGIHRGSSKYWPNTSIAVGGGQQGCFDKVSEADLQKQLKSVIRKSRSEDPAIGEFGDGRLIRKFGDVPDDVSGL
jgi:hypothetical protein